jgi:hypothetical protein
MPGKMQRALEQLLSCEGTVSRRPLKLIGSALPEPLSGHAFRAEWRPLATERFRDGRRSHNWGNLGIVQNRTGSIVTSCRLVPMRGCLASRRHVARISISTCSAAPRLSSAMVHQMASRSSVACGVS